MSRLDSDEISFPEGLYEGQEVGREARGKKPLITQGDFFTYRRRPNLSRSAETASETKLAF